MEQTTQALERRVERLERRLRFHYGTSLLILAMAVVGITMQSSEAQQSPARAVRARALIIEDERGRDRIIIAAPVPDPKEGKRRSPSTGLVINDPAGHERFGLGLREDGTVGMGFDAPPGTGDPRNAERINIVADAKGGAYIRFLNRKTQAAGFLHLDDKDQFALKFVDFQQGKIVVRQISFKGDEKVDLKQ